MIEPEVMGGAGAREAEGEVDANIRVELDPFVQPPILKAFFEVLPLAELAKCRLVSKLWYEESLSTWRSNATIRFRKDEIVSTRDDGSRRTTPLGEFLNLWEAGAWGSCPFKQFDLRFWKFKAEDEEQKRFLELVGGHITSLTVFQCEFDGPENYRRIIFQAFPKLQSLEIWDCVVGGGYGSSEGILVYEEPTFGVHDGLKSVRFIECPPAPMLMDTFSHFHKVNSLHLEPAGEAEYRGLLETIRLIRAQDRTKLPLKNFDVHFYFYLLRKDTQKTASYIELLKFQDQLNLPLQRLEIWFDLDDEEEDLDSDLKNKNIIRDILQSHSSTLKYLKFSWDPTRICKTFPFGVCLEKLDELKLSSHFLDHLNYLKATPNLRVLRLEKCNDDFGMAESANLFSNSGQLEIGDWTLPSLTELILELPMSAWHLGKLMKWMPNVERFEGVELDDVKFAMICSNWRNMRILEDMGEELTDEGVIGHEAGGDDVPNITKLEKLTTFETLSSRVTSASVHDGFLKLANLKKLSLGNCEELDDEAKAALKRRNITPISSRNFGRNCVIT